MSRLTVVEGDVAHLVILQAYPLGAIAQNQHCYLVRGAPQLVVYNPTTRRAVVIPWDRIAAIATEAGVDEPAREARH